MPKKLLFFLLLCFVPTQLLSITLQELITISFEKNSEIISVKKDYETAQISKKTVNGSYVPEINISSSTTIPKNYNCELPDSFLYGLTYTQPLPGGASISFETSYFCDLFDIQNEIFITQKQDLSLSLSQSLLPYWIQGQIKDPLQLSFEQQSEESYWQLMYTSKKVLQNLFQNYIYALLAQNELKIHTNTIMFYEEQIESLKQLKTAGNINQSRILEIENLKWTTQQSLIAVQTKYVEYIQNIKLLCNQDLLDNEIAPFTKETFESVLSNYMNPYIIEDPIEKIYQLKLDILKSQRIIERQASAIFLNITVQPEWNLETEKQKDWKKAWKNLNKPDNWNVNIGINLSPALAAIAKQNQKAYNIAYEAAKESYDSYLKQKAFVKQQYESLLEQYNNQQIIVSSLCESGINELNDYKVLFESQSISKLDYDTVKVRIENSFLTKENIELNILLYEFMIKIN